VPVYEATQEIDIAASAEACFGVLTDYERMPEWSSRMSECRVLALDEDGLAEEVEYAIDAVLRTVRYRLRQCYRAPHWIGSEYLGGDFRHFDGGYELDEQDGATHVTFHLRIDPGLRVPRPVARMLNENVMGRALVDLKRRAESLTQQEAADNGQG
jgi:ribosome-associated toxin RatA of RatAB toxin-antitoxin module